MFVPPSWGNTWGNAAANYDMGNYQNHYTLYTADGGQGRTMVAAAAAAEAAATAAAAAVAAANAAQEAAYAANAVTGNSNAYGAKPKTIISINQNLDRQGHQPFPARRRKLRPDDSWRKMPHQEGWRSFTWDCNRARSHKRYVDGYGAERGYALKSHSKQQTQHHIQPQQWRVRRTNYKGGYIATESGGHRTKAKDGQPRSIGSAGVHHGQYSSGERNRQAAAEVLKLLKEAVSVSTQTLADEAKGCQTEPFHDEAITFSLSTCDSDDDEAEFFPSTDSVHDSHQEDTERCVQSSPSSQGSPCIQHEQRRRT